MKRLTLLVLAGLFALLSCDDAAAPDPDPDPDPDPVFHTLTVTLSGDGAGTVTSSPAGIDCDADGGCSADFEEGTAVALTASPVAGHEFEAWSGACTGGSCTITVSADATADAAFDDPATVSQAVGSEGGTVTSSDGKVVLEIPAGALGNEEVITITTRDPDDLEAPFDTLSELEGPRLNYELGPDGLEFQVPVAVIAYPPDSAEIVPGESVVVPPVFLLTTEDGAPVGLDSMTLEVDSVSGALTVRGLLHHFTPLLVQIYEPFGQPEYAAFFHVEDVPDVLAVGETFTATAEFSSWPDFRDPTPRTYADFSRAPIVRQFDPPDQVMSPVNPDPNVADTWRGHYTYLCESVGQGRYKAVLRTEVKNPNPHGVFDVFLKVILRTDKPVRCVEPPDPTPLAPAPDATDGTAGVVNSQGQVAGRSGGHPAVWLDPTQPPTLLPVHPDHPDGGGFAWEGSDDLSKLGGVVFDAFFGTHAALWEDGELSLPDLGEGLVSSSITAISGNGDYAAATSYDGSASTGWFMGPDGMWQLLDFPDDAMSAKIDDVNDDGVGVGFVSTANGIRVAAWDLANGGQIIDLPPLPDAWPSSLDGVNASGTMVGTQTDPATGTRQGVVYKDGQWIIIPPDTDLAPSISLEGIGDNGVIACTLQDFANDFFRACVVAPGQGPVILDYFGGANTLPARRGISRDGQFFIGGTDPGTGAFTEGWVLPLNELVCPFCGMP